MCLLVLAADYDILAKRLRELSFLNSELRIVLTDERIDKSAMSLSTKATQYQFVSTISTQARNNEVFHFTSEQDDGIAVEVALQWTDTYNEKVFCFTNNIPQRDGGTHLSGFRSGAHAWSKQLYGPRKSVQERKSRGQR